MSYNTIQSHPQEIVDDVERNYQKLRAMTDVARTLAYNPDVLDTIRLALLRDSAHCANRLCNPATTSAQYWTDQLWQIDRARRALGLED